MDTVFDLSFVITVYNMEKYIGDCLNSVVNQEETSYKYEIIVVNDGSTDSSPSVINSFADKYSNIKVLNQQNSGLSIARNNGLEAAFGRWVWFLDSDDLISRKSLSCIEQYERNESVDAIVFSIENFTDREKYIFADRSKLASKIMNGRDYLCAGFPCQVPFTIYKRQYLIDNNLRMMPGIYHEDMEFSPRAYYGLERIGVLPDILYLRRINPNSITHSVNWKKSFDCITVAASLIDFSHNVSKRYRAAYYDLASRVLDHSLYDNETMDKETYGNFVQVIYENKFLFMQMRKAIQIKYKIQGSLYSIFPRHILQIYNILYHLSHKK